MIFVINQVLDRCTEIPNHLLKCLSTNHLAPCGSELYKCLIQQERRELLQKASYTEVELADRWSRRWRPFLHEALTSDVTLLQNNSSALLLPCTFQLFPLAVAQLLGSLDPFAPGHLHAWACIVSSYRATTGGSPWSLQGSSTLETLQLALESADDKVRLAALNILCCSLKTKDTPTTQEMSIMRTFITQNLNSESSPFRQHLQAGLKKFLVRIRDGCLARVRGQKSKKKQESVQFEPSQDILEQGIGERHRSKIQHAFKVYVLIQISFVIHRLCGMVGSAAILLPGPWTQLSEEKDGITAAVRSARDLHGLLEP